MSFRRLSSLILLAIALSPGATGAQESLIGPTGLGRLVRPLDARARGIGNAGVALHGRNLSAINPAALTQVTIAGLSGTWLPEQRTVKVGNKSSDVSTVDFPIFRITAPFAGNSAIGLSLGSFLDQDWTVQFVDTLELSTGVEPFEEIRESDGGVSEFRLELAKELVGSLSLGVAGIIYRGQTRRLVERVFEEDSDLGPYRSIAAIEYDGWGLAFGAQFQPIPEMIIGASGIWSPKFEISEDTTGEALSIDLPLTIDAGASLQLTPGFVVAISGGWARWSGVEDQLPQFRISDAWYIGGGTELRALSGETTAVLVRLGAHLDQQPFELQGGAPKERALSLGLGFSLRNGRAVLDTSFELGKRGSIDTHNVEESFRRFSVGLSIFGP